MLTVRRILSGGCPREALRRRGWRVPLYIALDLHSVFAGGKMYRAMISLVTKTKMTWDNRACALLHQSERLAISSVQLLLIHSSHQNTPGVYRRATRPKLVPQYWWKPIVYNAAAALLHMSVRKKNCIHCSCTLLHLSVRKKTIVCTAAAHCCTCQ